MFPKLDSKFILAPMEAVNCTSFRILCKKRGAGLLYTDMIEASEVTKDSIKKLINPNFEDHPLAIQLVGSNIEKIKNAIQILEPYADVFDLNASCPLGKILGKKAGAYLMKHSENLYKIIKEIKINTNKSLTVKLRSGWDKNSINVIEIAKELEKLGVDAIILHPRTKEQGYKGKADWNLVKKLKEEINIPVILSGDVFNSYNAKLAFQITKCDYIMIGRGAKVNPSIFSQLKDYENAYKKDKIYNKNEIDPIKDFLEWLELYNKIENRNNFSEIKDHALWTSVECKNNKEIKQKIINSKSVDEIIEIIKGLKF